MELGGIGRTGLLPVEMVEMVTLYTTSQGA